MRPITIFDDANNRLIRGAMPTYILLILIITKLYVHKAPTAVDIFRFFARDVTTLFYYTEIFLWDVSTLDIPDMYICAASIYLHSTCEYLYTTAKILRVWPMKECIIVLSLCRLVCTCYIYTRHVYAIIVPGAFSRKCGRAVV